MSGIYAAISRVDLSKDSGQRLSGDDRCVSWSPKLSRGLSSLPHDSPLNL